MNQDHISWRDVIQVDPDEDLLVYDLSPEEFQEKVEQIGAFLDFVECTDKGQELLRDIREQQKNNNDGEKVHIKLSDTSDSEATQDGVIIINTNTPDYLIFMDQSSGEAKAVSLERCVFHELCHMSDERLADISPGDILAEEYATQRTDAFACAYMPEMGLRVAYLNGAGKVPTMDGDGEKGMDMIKYDSYTQEEMEAAIKELPERIKDERQGENPSDLEYMDITNPCVSSVLKH